MAKSVLALSAALAFTLASQVLGEEVKVTSIVQPGGEVPKDYTPFPANLDHERRIVMIPMRDGVKLHTITTAAASPADVNPSTALI